MNFDEKNLPDYRNDVRLTMLNKMTNEIANVPNKVILMKYMS